ncbi:MAG: hypothetical protein H0T94_13015 [Acidimicrobiia bacterium]|nr:hypothetical protein [Acidimicrobiia bacterium]MDQ3501675.1 hypothetical protein [Actinomycetota bacterium]
MIEQLQALVPKRRLNREEALAIAELQAFRLRLALKVNEAGLSDQHLFAIPGVRVEAMSGLGVSGAIRRVGDPLGHLDQPRRSQGSTAL